MRHIKVYFVTGLLLLIPIFLIYEVMSIVAAVAGTMVQLPMLLNFILGLLLILTLGWVMIHILKRRLRKRLHKMSDKGGLLALVATSVLEFDNISNNTRKAFKNPILYEVESGTSKLGYITSDDSAFITDMLEGEASTPRDDDSVWVYAPHPINFFGELLLVHKSKVRTLSQAESHHLPLFILSGGIVRR